MRRWLGYQRRRMIICSRMNVSGTHCFHEESSGTTYITMHVVSRKHFFKTSSVLYAHHNHQPHVNLNPVVERLIFLYVIMSILI